LRRHGYFLTVAQVYEHPSVAAQAELLASPAAAARIDAVDPQRGTGQREAFTRFAALRSHG